MTITGSVTTSIPLSSSALYEYLLDFTRHPEWVSNLKQVTPTSDGPVRVGATFQCKEFSPPVSTGRQMLSMVHFITGLIQGSRPYSVAEITALEPGRRIAWTGKVERKEGDFNRSEWEVILEPDGDRTRLTQRFSYDPQTPAAHRMIAALGGAPGLEAGAATNLANLQGLMHKRNGAGRLPSS
jgi:hypothetical protein